MQQRNHGQETEVVQDWYDKLSLGVGSYKKFLGECGDESGEESVQYSRRKVKRV